MTLKNRLKSISWSLKLALHINWKMITLWTLFSAVLSVLPAIALIFNRAITHTLSTYLATGIGTYSGIVANIIIFGLILTVSGLSSRVNFDLLYLMMYDAYYIGMQKFLMDQAQLVDLYSLLDKEFCDEYFYCSKRQGSLTDFCAAGADLIGKTVGMISLLIVAFTISPLLFAATLVYTVAAVIMNIRMNDKYRVTDQQSNKDRRQAYYFEKMPVDPTMSKEIRIFKSYPLILKMWNKANDIIDNNDGRWENAMVRNSFFTGMLFYVLLIGALVGAVLQVSAGRMTPTDFLVLYALCQSISLAISNLTMNVFWLDWGLFSLNRQRIFYRDMPKLDVEADSKKSTQPKDENVCFALENVSFEYKPGESVIKNMDLEIKSGETIALVGENGSGKSTLAKLLLGLYPVTAGNLSFYGRPFGDYKRSFITENVSMFFQDSHIFHMSACDNIGLGDVHDMDNERIRVAAEKGGAASVINKLPRGMDTMLDRMADRNGVILSGGEKQRLGVARTHMSNRKIMIFDEPAAMLDPIAEMQQFKEIKEHMSGSTAILISHRMGFARLASRILVLSGGKIVEDGTHEQLMELNGLYATLFNEQAQWYDTMAEVKL